MALPPRAAAVYVLLSKPDTTPFTARDTGTNINGLVSMGTPEPYAPAQSSFYSSQQWYLDYPDEVVAKVHLGLVTAGGYIPNFGAFGNRIYLQGFSGNQSIESTYPGSIVYAYDPTPPPGPAEPAPNPNGNTASNTSTTTTPNTAIPGYFYRPRWTTDTAYDVTTSGTGQGTVWPEFNTDYLITPTGFQSYIGGPSEPGPWSVDLTVMNFDSEVLNEQTMGYEYYPFAQTSFDYKQTTKVKLYIDANVCCWNDGTVIDGTVTFQALDVTVDPVGTSYGSTTPNLTASYGFGGMLAKTGSTVTSAGSQSFSVTVEDGYVPIEITIPTSSGKITFINDFSVDTVTPPA